MDLEPGQPCHSNNLTAKIQEQMFYMDCLFEARPMTVVAVSLTQGGKRERISL